MVATDPRALLPPSITTHNILYHHLVQTPQSYPVSSSPKTHTQLHSQLRPASSHTTPQLSSLVSTPKGTYSGTTCARNTNRPLYQQPRCPPLLSRTRLSRPTPRPPRRRRARLPSSAPSLLLPQPPLLPIGLPRPQVMVKSPRTLTFLSCKSRSSMAGPLRCNHIV